MRGTLKELGNAAAVIINERELPQSISEPSGAVFA